MTTIQQKLHDDHDRIAGLLAELVDTVAAADGPTIVRTWTDFERGVLTHFEAEEEYLLPLLEAAHPVETQTLREEHAQIRKLIAELGVRADLHEIRLEVVEELTNALRAHAAREDRLLYAWADEHAEQSVRDLVVEMIEGERRRRRDPEAEAVALGR